MLYVSGRAALNIPCQLRTDGDWHRTAIDWDNVRLHKSGDSIFGEYGIERQRDIPWLNAPVNVANHLRALLDLLDDGQLSSARGMRHDFINNEQYTRELMDHVWMLRSRPHWEAIDQLMGREYTMDWVRFKEGKEIGLTAEQAKKKEWDCKSSHCDKVSSLEATVMDDIRTYGLDTLFAMKKGAYESRGTLRDLYDISFLCAVYWDKLSESNRLSIADTFQRKGFEYFNYIVYIDDDPSIDKNRLTDYFNRAMQLSGLGHGNR